MQEEQVNTFMVAMKAGLPAKLEDLVPMSFMGQAAVEFYRTRIKTMQALNMTEEQRKATLADGQDAGKMLLDIEARIGELLPSPEEARKTRDGDYGLGHHRTLPEEFGDDSKHRRYRAHQARTIARNPEAVAEVIREAEENEDIPTKTAVLTRIKLDKERERREKAEREGRTQKTELQLTTEQSQYLLALDRILQILPSEPPKDWTEVALQMAKAKVIVIKTRLEVFDD